MRPGQQNRRGRNRSGSTGGSSSSNGGGNAGAHRKPQNALSRNYESNGPDVKIRGSAQHVAEKYLTLARDAQSSGDRIMAESYLQHAEHYNRIIMTAQAQMQQNEQQPGGQQMRQRRPDGDPALANDPQGADDDDDLTSNTQPASSVAPAQADQPNPRQGVNGRRRRARYQSDGDADSSDAGSDNSRRPSPRSAARVPGQSEQPDIISPKPFAADNGGEAKSDASKAGELKADASPDGGGAATPKPTKPVAIDISKDDIVV